MIFHLTRILLILSIILFPITISAQPNQITPHIINNQPYIPVRTLSHLTALEIYWDNTTKTATIKNAPTTLKILPDQKKIYLNNQDISLYFTDYLIHNNQLMLGPQTTELLLVYQTYINNNLHLWINPTDSFYTYGNFYLPANHNLILEILTPTTMEITYSLYKMLYLQQNDIETILAANNFSPLTIRQTLQHLQTKSLLLSELESKTLHTRTQSIKINSSFPGSSLIDIIITIPDTPPLQKELTLIQKNIISQIQLTHLLQTIKVTSLTEKENVLEITNYLSRNIKYLPTSNISYNEPSIIYQAIKEGHTNAIGYSVLLNNLLDQLNINSEITINAPHAWNTIFIDNQAYQLDIPNNIYLTNTKDIPSIQNKTR